VQHGNVHFVDEWTFLPSRCLGRSTPEKSSDRLMSKAAAIFTSVARFGVQMEGSVLILFLGAGRQCPSLI
jgi:hypothetical protein